MNYITTTELRTKSSELIASLKRGDHIRLVHRSKVIGKIEPFVDEVKPFNPEAFRKLTEKLNLPKTTYAEREKIYRDGLMKKYGKHLSGR